jgi:hypothetical protein
MSASNLIARFHEIKTNFKNTDLCDPNKFHRFV